MEFKIDENLANELLNYIATKPYKEVVVLIQKLQSLEKIDTNATKI